MEILAFVLVLSLLLNLALWDECRARGRILEEQQELIDEYRKATDAVGKVARS